MRILIGMSGGLDSTYAAYLLKEQGNYVEGAVLRMSEHTNIAFADESSGTVGIKLNIIDCESNFKKYVIDNMIEEYSAGRTPNPCIMCNRYVKIACLCDYAKANGFDKVATGHYADVKFNGNRYYIECADDISKDQSYVLWQLTQEQLSMLITPLAGYTKNKIRAEASALGFKSAERAESQEICFIPDNDYAGYIERERGKYPEGDFIDVNGKIVGHHMGIIHYTIGQRKKLGISLGRSVFVTKIDPLSNTVTIADSGGEFTDRMQIRDIVFQNFEPSDIDITIEASVKVRYSAKLAAAKIMVSGKEAEVKFYDNVRAITSGQSAVVYDNGKILFGGFIK